MAVVGLDECRWSRDRPAHLPLTNASTHWQHLLSAQRMPPIFRNSQGHFRNGWWILAFVAIFLASQVIYRPVSHALQQHGFTGLWLAPLPVIAIVLVTWLCTR